MHKIYEKMQADGLIGPMEMRNGQLQFREFQEYPKMLYPQGMGKGKPYVIVKNLAEEIEVMGGIVKEHTAPDPLEIERKKLLEASEALKTKERHLDEEVAKMKAQLAEMQSQMLGSPKPTSAPTTPAPSTAEAPKALGSKFRPLPDVEVQ